MGAGGKALIEKTNTKNACLIFVFPVYNAEARETDSFYG